MERVSTTDSDLDPAVAGRLKRTADGLVAAVVQQHDTGEVLMLGWMDDEALHRTLTTGRGTYWSRSRQDYWVKGETSGHTQRWSRCASTVTATRSCSRSTSPARPATPGRTPVSTTTSSSRAGPMAERSSTRRTFGPVVLLGLASAGLAAIASAKPWVGGGSTGGASDCLDDRRRHRHPLSARLGDQPRAARCLGSPAGDPGAVSRVVLRGRGSRRRGPGHCGGRRLRHASGRRAGLLRRADGARVPGHRVHRLVLDGCRVLGDSAGPGGLAVRLAPTWPEMGSRYDAPGAASTTGEQSAPETDQDLWHALDEGRDPTDTNRRA